jgi:hypothetical protein
VLEEPVARIDGWRIRNLRAQPRPRLEKLFLENGSPPGCDLVLVAARVDALTEQVFDLQLRMRDVEWTTRHPGENHGGVVPRGCVLFVPSSTGYSLLEVDELCSNGRGVVLEGRAYSVQRIGRSPLPGDRRPCLFLQLSA